ncbi:MAG: outer membrane beta-barrel protein [Bryobacterales bacterium]|nr:outer membrane beta-barrel protein [Bryobacterales bacterium]
MLERRWCTAVAFLALLCGNAGVARAEGIDFGVGIGRADAGKRSAGTLLIQGDGGVETPSDITMGSGFTIVPRMTLNAGDYISHDLSFAYSRANVQVNLAGANLFDQSTSIGQAMYNMLLHATKDGSRFRPYVAGGGGLVMFYPPGAGLTSGVNTVRPGVNYGAGLRVQVNERWHARVDFRQTLAPNPRLFQGQDASGLFRQNQFTIGAGISF